MVFSMFVCLLVVLVRPLSRPYAFYVPYNLSNMHDEVVRQLAKDLLVLANLAEKHNSVADVSPLLHVDELFRTLVYTRQLRCCATGSLAEPIDAYTKVRSPEGASVRSKAQAQCTRVVQYPTCFILHVVLGAR